MSLKNYLLNYLSLKLGRAAVRPLLFSYYITHRCNLNCFYCSDGKGNPFKADPIPEMGTDEAMKMIRILSKSSNTLDITGGEPLLRQDLEQILSAAQICKMRTMLNTNGIGLNERPNVLRYSDVVVISLDALNEEKIMTMTDGSQEDALAIRRGVDAAVKSGRKVVLSTVATPRNLKDAGEVLDYAMRNRLGFHISPQLIGTQVNQELRDNAEYRALIERVIRAKKSGGGVLGVEAYLKGIRDFTAYDCQPFLMMVIRPDGHMYYPCLEQKSAPVRVNDFNSYEEALAEAKRLYGPLTACPESCHIFCHMGLSLLQRHMRQAIGEGRHWRHVEG